MTNVKKLSLFISSEKIEKVVHTECQSWLPGYCGLTLGFSCESMNRWKNAEKQVCTNFLPWFDVFVFSSLSRIQVACLNIAQRPKSGKIWNYLSRKNILSTASFRNLLLLFTTKQRFYSHLPCHSSPYLTNIAMVVLQHCISCTPVLV